MTGNALLGRPARVFADGTLGDPQLDHPEGIAVGADGAVWCGGERGQIFRIERDGSAFEQITSTGGFCLGVAFGPCGGLFVCDLKHAAVLRVDVATAAVERFASGGRARPLRMPNFPVFDADGRLYVSDSRGRDDRGPGVFRFDSDGSGAIWSPTPLDFANGLALAPDGNALYVAETFGRAVRRIPIQADGTAGRPEVIARLPGRLPDGLAFASDGGLYVGCYEPSQVLRIEPDGTVGIVADDPDAHLLCHPTNLAFRGDQLFAANLGRWHVTVIDAGVGGIALPARATRASPDGDRSTGAPPSRR